MSEEKKIPFSHNEEYVDKQLRSINQMLEHRNYSLMNGIINASNEIYRSRRINRNSLRRALADPYNPNNVEILQQASMMLKATNGIYKRVLNYHASMYTHDFMLLPLEVDKIKTPSKIQKAYAEASQYIEKFNIKYNSSWIKERVLEQGELFVYKIEDSGGIILQEIPNTFCKITSVENDVSKYAINLKKLSDNNIVFFPKEIQLLYRKFKKGNINKNDLIDGCYYELKNNAIAFNLNRFAPKGIPYYCTIFDDLMELEDMKDLKSQNAVIESIKLIHQKFPVDKDTGVSLIDFDVITQYHNATKSTLPQGTAVTTNPLDLQALYLSDSNSKISSNVSQARDTIYDSAGVNSELFNGNKNTTEAIAMGIIADNLVAKPLNDMINNWINYELRKKKIGGLTWTVKMLDTTEFNKDKRINSAKEAMAYGGSRLEFLARSGYTPLQSLSVLKMESMLGLDELMIPQSTSHTQSSSDVGRPSKEDGGTGNEDTVTPEAQN